MSLKPAKPLSRKQEGDGGQKQTKGQKVVVDTRQKVKFAITNSQNTSVQMRYALRQSERGIGKELASGALSRQPDGKRTSRSKQERHMTASETLVEGPESRPLSHPTLSDSHPSETSYQRYIISQTTDYVNMDSNATTKAANTPAPIIIEEGISVSVSGVGESFQPSTVELSRKSYETFQSDEMSEVSELHSHSLSQLESKTDNESDSRPDSSVGKQASSAQVSIPQSGRVTIEVDMRFQSMDRRGSEPSQSSSIAGGDRMSMSAFSENSCAYTTDRDESQPLMVDKVADSETEIGRVESDRRSPLGSNSTLSLGSTDDMSNRQESEDSEGDPFHHDDDEVGIERHDSDVEQQPSKLILQDPIGHDSQPHSRSTSKSSVSYHSEADSQTRSKRSLLIGDDTCLNVELPQPPCDEESKTITPLEHSDEDIPVISATDEPEGAGLSLIHI